VTEFTLPELGENIAAGDVVRVLVHVGDSLEKDQPVLELETDKATIEVPSSVAGQVKELRIKPGDKVKVGQPILVVDESAAGAAPAPSKSEATPAPGKVDDEAVSEGGMAVEVESRPGSEARARDERQQGLGHLQHDYAAPSAPAARRVVDISAGRPVPAPTAPVPAAPSTRRAARELGVDIAHVQGTGPGGRISMDDVKTYARSVIASGGGASFAAQGGPLPDFSKWGEVERQPMRAIRRKTAEHMTLAWTTIPHVTQFDKADITALEELRKKYSKRVEAGGGKLTVTAIAVKVIAAALKVFPQFNASVDLANEQVVYKKYVNIGIAVDTEFGLLVPVIRDADKKNIVQIAADLAQVAEKAKARKLAPDEMQGGSFSISNLGGIGGTYFTPIVNTPEVAILGISRSVTEPVFVNGEFEPRLMMPLSLSYDHRVIDGADGIRFLRWVVDALEQPFVLSLEG
jgi:pyruvate dehydrogenase E2 component (dihydrolipoamide acetyltransferase)